MNPSLDYTTRCRVPGCTKTFVSSALDIPIIGQPNAQTVKFVTALIDHVQKKHPQVMMQVSGAIQEYMGFLVTSLFEIEDPRLAEMREQIRAGIAEVSRRNVISDADIADRVARLELDPDDEEPLNELLKDMRDVLCEQGRYAPQNGTQPAPPVTPA